MATTPSLYPVYWNVNGWDGYVPEGSPELPVHITRFGFLAPNLTQTGGGCTTLGCQGCNHSHDCEPYPCPQKYWRACWQGDFPVIHDDGTRINGGVPQAANLSAHLALLRRTLPLGMRANYTGVAAIDFEDWTPIWDNDGSHDSWHSSAYRDLSIALVKKAHPGYTNAEATAAAQNEFEAAALRFFLETLKVCQEVRPNATWGAQPNPMLKKAFVF